MTVRRGDYRDHTLAEVIDRVRVPADGWVDVSDVRRRANAWLTQAAQRPHKPTAGAGASPTPAPAVPAEVSRDADQ
jgi:hypothetical protein